MDDREHLERAVRGDRAALRRVVDAWMPRIRRWALLGTGDPIAAEDAVQESLVRLLRAIDSYDPDRPFGPWLKALVCNAARNEAAKHDRRDRHETAATGEERDDAPQPGDHMDLDRASRRVREAFAHLPPRQREILDLVDLQGETPSEVALQLGLTPGAVRGQLFQARRAIRTVLADAPDAILPLLRGA